MQRSWRLFYQNFVFGQKESGNCTSHFKRAVCISCRPCVDVHKGEGGLAHVDACGQGGGGVKNVIFCGRHKWMAPYFMHLFKLYIYTYFLHLFKLYMWSISCWNQLVTAF